MVTGLVRAESRAAVTLHTGTQVVEVPRADVAKVRQSGESPMAEGLLTAVPRQDLRDLFSYLRSDAAPPPGK